MLIQTVNNRRTCYKLVATPIEKYSFIFGFIKFELWLIEMILKLQRQFAGGSYRYRLQIIDLVTKLSSLLLMKNSINVIVDYNLILN